MNMDKVFKFLFEKRTDFLLGLQFSQLNVDLYHLFHLQDAQMNIMKNVR